MIILNKLNGSVIVVNAELIETIEPTPDTIITLSNGKKMVVSNPVDEVIDKVVQYKRSVLRGSRK
ncbi:MAG: flagellar FlbD family protein [Peptococcaceae bacterium]|nr:flagellar FlbD family protein [Peptococcaceae bacterium]MDH7524042.1 flagellar FlbD family protein [Peptococcaceae bacterium]